MAAAIPVLRSQFVSLPYPTQKFTGKTVIVTGSNTGIGLEAARHFVRLEAAKVILAVRTPSKGQAAKRSIDTTEHRPDVIEIWQLDLASYDSVKAFAAKAFTLERLDVLVSNAGVWMTEFALVGRDETHLTVNVVNTVLLALMVLPKMRETSVRFDTEVVCSFTGSFVHTFTTMPERKAANIMEDLNVEARARMVDRYNVSKLILLFVGRALAEELDKSNKCGSVIVNVVNPGIVDTGIFSNLSFLKRVQYAPLKLVFRTAEVGGRTLVWGAAGSMETNGKYMSDCKVVEPSNFVKSEDGVKTQKKLWIELKEKLEKIQPGVVLNI